MAHLAYAFRRLRSFGPARFKDFLHKAEEPRDDIADREAPILQNNIGQTESDVEVSSTTDADCKSTAGSTINASPTEVRPGIGDATVTSIDFDLVEASTIEHDSGTEAELLPSIGALVLGCCPKTGYNLIPTPYNENAHLLGLPYELRLEIYRYVLLKSGKITIDTNIPPEPGLLGVNRQIREEASEVYYNENTFRGYIFHFDAALYIRWRQLSRFEPIRPTCKWKTRSSHNFANLKSWLKSDFDDDEQDLSLTVREEGKPTVDIGAFDLARRLKDAGRPWEEIESLLDPVLQILIATDKRWRRD